MLERQNSLSVCAICFEDIGSAAELARPSVCEHKFCRGCLEHLCRSSQSPRRCPLDRKSFDKICVLDSMGQETLFDAATLAQLGRIFASPAAPASLACLLLAVLWVSPNWLLAGHIASIGAVFWYTNGIANWELYIIQSIAFYGCLVPMKFFGFLLIVNVLFCGALIVLMCRQVPDLASSSLTPEKVLLAFTCPLVFLIFLGLVFSTSALAQFCCYLFPLLLITSMQVKLCELFGPRYTCFSLLFSCLVTAPFLCLLSDLTWPHLLYNCALAAYLVFVAFSPANQQQLHISFVGLHLSKMVCYYAPSVMLGFSPWTALYTVAVLGYFSMLIQTSLIAKLYQSVPLVVLVNSAALGIALPWQLFGLLPYLGSLVPVGVSCVLTDLLIQRIGALPTTQLLFPLLLQFAALGVLLPAALF